MRDRPRRAVNECRFCRAEAIAVVALDQGCTCHPEDREQMLCLQHMERATPLGSMEVTKWLTLDGKEPAWQS